MVEITIYTKPLCPFCNNLKRILKGRGIAYTDFDTEKNEPPRHVVDRDGHIPVPQVDINGRIIYDYATEEALADEIERLAR